MSSVDAIPVQLLKDGERAMTICNACRYCEGFCAVFPAMERRLTFSPQDLGYLANLCHDCRECYHSCQPGFPFCLSRMALLYTRPPPSARNSGRRTIVQLQRLSLSPR